MHNIEYLKRNLTINHILFFWLIGFIIQKPVYSISHFIPYIFLLSRILTVSMCGLGIPVRTSSISLKIRPFRRLSGKAARYLRSVMRKNTDIHWLHQIAFNFNHMKINTGWLIKEQNAYPRTVCITYGTRTILSKYLQWTKAFGNYLSQNCK